MAGCCGVIAVALARSCQAHAFVPYQLGPHPWPCRPHEQATWSPLLSSCLRSLQTALELSQLEKFTGRKEPTVIT